MKIWRSKDFYAGMMFLIFGLAAVWGAGRYHLGTAARMGPGYFPTMLGGGLAVLGLVIAARALWSQEAPVQRQSLRPVLLVIISVASFAAVVQPLGLVLATLALILISCFGGKKVRLGEVTVLCLLLVFLAVVLFAWGLGIPFKIWPF